MNPSINPFETFKLLKEGERRYYYSLPALEKQGIAVIHRLPVTIRILLESLLRNCDGKRIKEVDILRLARWNPKQQQSEDVSFIVSRVILQDFTGVPLLVDLAAMRDAVATQNFNPSLIEPKVPVDLVVDHSVQVDRSGSSDAFLTNLKIEFERNRERYSFLKWGQNAFDTFGIVPPGIGIVHQVNLEYLATVVTKSKQTDGEILYPDTLVGTDSHTTMINALGVLGWGVGGIEAEAAMLGQPVSMQMPEVIGVLLEGRLQEGVTATDLTLRITELLRKENVVGKFVEFFGEGAGSLTVADRGTIANMAPEYGATVGFFPVDDKTIEYLKMTGREEADVTMIKDYLVAQKLFGMPLKGEIDFTKVLELDLGSILPAVAGPKRPQDRINLTDLKPRFEALLSESIPKGGYGKTKEELEKKIGVHYGGSFYLNNAVDSGGISSLDVPNGVAAPWSELEMVSNRPFTSAAISPSYPIEPDFTLSHGSVVIAAITSCTNTSNPSVMIAAGLLAKKAVELGLKVDRRVKTSLAPGSRVVTDYLEKTGLQKYLDTLGFQLVAYGCTTCIGNSGPLDEHLENAVKEHDLIVASVLSGNRNFEARIHSSVKANFLMSPPLVVAFALAGKVDIDMEKEPIGYDKNNKPVYLKQIWPSTKEIQDAITSGIQPSMFKHRYSHIDDDNPVWKEIKTATGAKYAWEENSTYIQKPPYFEGFGPNLPPKTDLKNMKALALFGDSVTTDHISPAGAFKSSSPAGKYLLSLGVTENEFNSYGSRRGNHHVMMRGTFANTRLINKMAEDNPGGFTRLIPENTIISIFEACQEYAKRKTPLIVFAGKDYGMGSSRDWAAKGPALLGVKAVVARSFERIHRSNLIGMGIIPLQFQNNESAESLNIVGDETFTLKGIENAITVGQEVVLEITKDGQTRSVKLTARFETPIEVEYYQHGGILPYVLRQLLKKV